MTGKHTHSDQCGGVVLPSVYDGIAYWECDDGTDRHRFPPDTPVGETD